MPRNLWNEFAADRLDHRALQHIVQRHFPSGSQPGFREVVYPGGSEYAVKLRFAKDDRLLGIEAGPGLTDAIESTLTNALKDALVDLGPQVVRHVRFANHKVGGSWRYKDSFQIAPVPEHAPQLDCLIGDHPFLLEVKIIRSKDDFVTTQRAVDATRTAELLLTGLVNNSVRPLTARPMYGYWVRLPETNQAAYRQPFYHYADTPGSGNEFSLITTPATTGFAEDLFGPNGMLAGAPFSIPHGLTELLDLFHTLPLDLQEKFLRSCYWLRQAHRSFLESFSAAFMAVVTAAEAIFDSNSAAKCETCGQTRYRLRSSFATLLDTCAPFAQVATVGQPSFQSRLKHLYDTRSRISHGSDLRGWDTAHGFTPLLTQDDSDLRTLLRVMPLALAKWLQNNAPGERERRLRDMNRE